MERASLYDPSKPFACLDGSAVVPYDHVNDDYCDCRDGSDEPGTAACLNGVFTCENRGHTEQVIPSLRVNDGICDCCDGSDELKSGKQCENTCNFLARKAREDQEKARKLLETGVAKKNELIKQGLEIRETIQKKLKELEVARANLENEKTKMEEIKNEAEGAAKTATDAQDKQIAEEAELAAAKEKDEKSLELFKILDSNQDDILSAEELEVHSELDSLFDNDGRFTLDEAQRFLDHRQDVNAQVFFDEYYAKLLGHIVLKPSEPPAEQQTMQDDVAEAHEPEEEPGSEEETVHHEEDEDPSEDGVKHEFDSETIKAAQQRHKFGGTTTENPNSSKYNEETLALLERANSAKNLLHETETKLNSIENEINSNKKKLDHDVGQNFEYTALIDQCFEYEDREYVYKLCPFDRTVQKSKSNHQETSIGKWKSWVDGTNYRQMTFENGQNCWNGPDRSTKVYITCGSENKLTAVSEPNRCEYEFRFETPCACNETDLQKQLNEEDHDEL